MASNETNKKTLCGYTWTDIYSALNRGIGKGEMNSSQRWAAELLCSETGVSRLEAILLAIWAEHVNSALASWPAIWHVSVNMFRDQWMKAGGDNRTFRNNPNIRNRIAECVGYLVVSSKKPRATLPKSSDVMKEAEAIKTRLQSGGASPDQPATQRVWDSHEDAPTLRTLGNELEAAIRTAQTTRALFWLVWILTLDGQKTRPNIKERAPEHIQGKSRKSLAWFIWCLLKDMAEKGLDYQDTISQTLDCMIIVWTRLGARYRKEVFGTIIIMLCERVKSMPMEIRQPVHCLDIRHIKTAMTNLDTIYEDIARDMKIVSTPVSVESKPGTNTMDAHKNEQKNLKNQTIQKSAEKMDNANKVLWSLYGMDEED